MSLLDIRHGPPLLSFLPTFRDTFLLKLPPLTTTMDSNQTTSSTHKDSSDQNALEDVFVDEDWRNVKNFEQRRRIQNRNAQRNFSKSIL